MKQGLFVLRIEPWLQGFMVKILSCALSFCWVMAAGAQTVKAQDRPVRLLDRAPFDRITLDAANQGVAIEVLPLDLPGRRVPQPLPSQGSLKLRRVVEPSLEYSVAWDTIDRIDLYEQLLLTEAVKLLNGEKMGAAFDLLSMLHKNYPGLPRLQQTTDHYLHRDAIREFRAGRHNEALAILLSLHDRNPNYSGLGKAVEAVGDRLIRKHLAEKKYFAARKVLEFLEQAYTGIQLELVLTWKQRFRQASQRQLKIARATLDQKQFEAARAALHQAREIMPQVTGIGALLARLDREHPEIVVGVARHAPVQAEWPANRSDLTRGSLPGDISGPLADWAAIRVAPLVHPPLIERIGFEAEGGVYHCPWAKLKIDESGLKFSLQLTPDALRLGAQADDFARTMLALVDPANPNYLEDFSNRFQDLSLSQGRSVEIRWQSVPVRPEALLRCSAHSIASLENCLTYYRRDDKHEPGEVRFRRQGSHRLLHDNQQRLAAKGPVDHGPVGIAQTQESGPLTIVERQFHEDEAAVQALLHGEVDLLDRVPPWQLEKLRASDQVVVGTYRLPTIHVLRLNPRIQLLDQREFRRALCYGIDRELLVQDILLAGQSNPGFRGVSGPFPVGQSRHDPVGYAYNQQLEVRPYEPHLAAVLAEVARVAVAKIADAAKRQDPPEPSKSEEALSEKSPPEETRPLVLRYPPEPVARAVCQSIKIQLERIGIPIELSELHGRSLGERSQMTVDSEGNADQETPNADDYDLLYTELAMWEPIVDARRLLGPDGVAGRCSPSMGLALDRVDRAQNWKQVQESLQQVHRIAHYDLPVIPLWQTYSFFAHRKRLHGFGEAPISFYQQVAQWHKE